MGQAESDGLPRPVAVWSRRPRPWWAALYIRALAVISISILCVLVWAQIRVVGLHPSGRFPVGSFVVLLAIAVFAEAYTIRVGPRTEISAGFLVCFLSTAIVGPLAGFAIAVGSQLLGVRERKWERTLCYAATMGIVMGSTSLLYWVILRRIGGLENSSTALVAAIGLGVGMLYQVLNFGLVVPVMWLRGGIGLGRAWRLFERPFLPFIFFFLAISIGLVAAYQLYLKHFGSKTYNGLYATLIVMLSLLPVLGLIYAFRAYAQQRELADVNARLAGRNERLALQAVASQITALDLKDDYTARHSAAVAQWASDIAEALKLSDRERNLTHLASLLHDVGKIGIPDDVLKSPVKLDRVNWSLIEGHCYNGYKILKHIDEFDELATVVLHHHERFDGTGYPRGLAGEKIPLASRIICVADSYSAMVSDRPYGPALSPAIGMAELELHKGTQFDPEIVDCFLAILEALDDCYRRGQEADFQVEVQAVKFLRDLPAESFEDEGRTSAAAPSKGTRRRSRNLNH
jgi:HD-GYP domain-containing protein (c-di-GMP phosphodiesterase class II)